MLFLWVAVTNHKLNVEIAQAAVIPLCKPEKGREDLVMTAWKI